MFHPVRPTRSASRPPPCTAGNHDRSDGIGKAAKPSLRRSPDFGSAERDRLHGTQGHAGQESSRDVGQQSELLPSQRRIRSGTLRARQVATARAGDMGIDCELRRQGDADSRRGHPHQGVQAAGLELRPLRWCHPPRRRPARDHSGSDLLPAAGVRRRAYREKPFSPRPVIIGFGQSSTRRLIVENHANLAFTVVPVTRDDGEPGDVRANPHDPGPLTHP